MNQPPPRFKMRTYTTLNALILIATAFAPQQLHAQQLEDDAEFRTYSHEVLCGPMSLSVAAAQLGKPIDVQEIANKVP